MKNFIALFVMLFPMYLYSNNYYISSTGSDTNDGLSEGKAFKSIQHATSVCTTGDTVFVTEGEYSGFDHRDVSGTAEKPIVYKALGEVKIINAGPVRNDGINIENANYIEIDGFNSSNMSGSGNGIRLVNADNCIVRNCVCDKNAERGIFTGFTDKIVIEYNKCSNSVEEHGIYVSNSSDNAIIRFNECFGNNGCGIHMNGDLSMGEDGINHSPQIYNNYIHDNNHAAGINLDGVHSPLIYNNILYNNHSSQGIVLFKQDGAIVSHAGKIFNNTIIVPIDGRWGILLQDGANDGTEIFNNIIINEHSWRGCICVYSTANLKCDYNIVNNRMSISGDDSTISLTEWQTNGLGEHSLNAENAASLFTDYPKHFDLLENSIAVNAGSAKVTAIKKDYYKEKRISGGLIDIGAIEYQFIGTQITTDVNTTVVSDSYTYGTVYPTIVSNNFAIKNADNVSSVQLLTLEGSVFKEYSQFDNMNIKNLKEGIYLVLITYSNGHNQKEIIAKVSE